MKTKPVAVIRLIIMVVIITGVYSFKTSYFPRNSFKLYQDSLNKKGIALTGAQEVPPVTTSGSGTLDVAYDKGSKTLRYSARWSGMSDSVTMMHFHGPADKGANAGVVYPIHEFTRGMSGTADGTVKLDEAKMKEADLLGGKWYYNIHTKTHPAGEIRGQVEF